MQTTTFEFTADEVQKICMIMKGFIILNRNRPSVLNIEAGEFLTKFGHLENVKPERQATPLTTEQEFMERYTDGAGNAFSDADSGL